MNAKLILLAGLLVVLACMWGFRATNNKPPQQMSHVAAKCSNADCGNEFTVDLPSGFARFEEFPRTCPKCNQKTAYQMVICSGCQTHYPNNESRERPTKCAKCGQELLGE